MNKIIADLVVILAILISYLQCTYAAEIVDSGICGAQGDNLTWTLNSEGKLTISGTGDMADNEQPWDELNFNKVIIEDGVTSIGKQSFWECYNMTSIEIPNSVTSINPMAFLGSEDLADITVMSSNQNYCSQGGNLFSKDKKTLIQYAIGKNDKRYTVPDGVAYIDGYAFTRCSSIEEIILPDSISKINNGSAFGNCTNLTQITFPNGITYIGTGAFSECWSLTSVIIPDSVLSIGEQAFFDCIALRNIDVALNNQNYCSPDGNLFSKDKKTLIQYAIGKNDTRYTVPDSITHIEKWAFCGSNLENITIPFGVTYIGDEAFALCTNLKHITLPNSVTYIGEEAFRECYNLTNIKIPNGITSISGMTFYFCESLKSVKIPNSVTSIGRLAFECCYELTSVTIPDSITGIGASAFSGCDNLTDIYYTGTEEQWNVIAIGDYNDKLIAANIHYLTMGVPLKANVTKSVNTDKNQVIFNVSALEEDRAEELEDISLFVAEYDEQGCLTNIVMGEKSKVSDNNLTVTAPLPTLQNYKYMMWDSLCSPMMDAITDIY